ncbi:MAG: YegS/Rv2252/BmrU family lipid kinase [Cyclobacteriaceae bacterium]
MSSEVKKVFFIVNKYSGSGYREDVEGLILSCCKENNIEGTIAYTHRPGHATTLAAEALSAGFQKVVAVGGDGTVNEVAQGLLHTHVAMGIIPKGSGNGLARHLGIPLKINLALKCLFTSQKITMDTFRINGKLSLNVSGIGFDGHIADLFGADTKRGLQGYTKHILNEFMNFPEFDARITYGEIQIKKMAFVIAIANSSQYGNNARIAPAASICDQLLDISILKKIPPYRLDFVYSFFSGTIDQSAYCETLQVRDAEIQLNGPMAFHVDGEPAGKAEHFFIEIVPASLNILAPLERSCKL